MGQQRCSRPLWWKERFKEEAAWSRRSKKEYSEANRRIQKAVKKAKENWIGAQCEEIETCLNKNNSKRAYQLVKDLISEKQGGSSTIQDKSGKCLTEEKEILSRWTEYCSELYNYGSCGDNAVLDCSQPPEEDLQPILREEVEIAVASLKKGQSARVDNIPAELVQAGGETMVDVLTEICNRIWRTGEWPTPWTQSLIMTLPKKGNLQLCQNYRTISLISYSSKVMLEVILNKLKLQAEEIILKNRLRSEPEEAPQNRSSTLESCVKSTSNISIISAMSSLISKSLWQSVACSLMGHHAEVQYQCKSSSHNWAALWQGYTCRPDEWQHWRMVQNNSRSKARMSSVTHPLQHFSWTDHVWCPGRTWWEGEHRRQKYYQFAVCRWHRCSSWGKAGARSSSRKSRQNLHKV